MCYSWYWFEKILVTFAIFAKFPDFYWAFFTFYFTSLNFCLLCYSCYSCAIYQGVFLYLSHRKKRMKQLQKKIKSGTLDLKKDDPFELFISATNIRYCYYAETHKILGNTYGMCVLQVILYMCMSLCTVPLTIPVKDLYHSVVYLRMQPFQVS